MASLKVVAFSAETAEVSGSVLKRPPADEGTPSLKGRDLEEGTSPEGIIY